ncbi:MAG: hypothetical protein ABL888_21880 [Pirellulaceae bacterium]
MSSKLHTDAQNMSNEKFDEMRREFQGKSFIEVSEFFDEKKRLFVFDAIKDCFRGANFEADGFDFSSQFSNGFQSFGKALREFHRQDSGFPFEKFTGFKSFPVENGVNFFSGLPQKFPTGDFFLVVGFPKNFLDAKFESFAENEIRVFLFGREFFEFKAFANQNQDLAFFSFFSFRKSGIA